MFTLEKAYRQACQAGIPHGRSSHGLLHLQRLSSAESGLPANCKVTPDRALLSGLQYGAFAGSGSMISNFGTIGNTGTRAGAGAAFPNGGTLTNAASSGTGNVTLANAGTILGTGGQAVSLAGTGTHRLVIALGAMFGNGAGGVAGVYAQGSTTNTLEFTAAWSMGEPSCRSRWPR